jgi:hypothetical protein
VHPAATQNFPVLPDFSFDITLFGVLTANYCKLCVRVQRKQSEIVKERQERNVRKRVLRIIFTIKTNGGFPIFLTSTVTEIFMEMSFCTPERFNF